MPQITTNGTSGSLTQSQENAVIQKIAANALSDVLPRFTFAEFAATDLSDSFKGNLNGYTFGDTIEVSSPIRVNVTQGSFPTSLAPYSEGVQKITLNREYNGTITVSNRATTYGIDVKELEKAPSGASRYEINAAQAQGYTKRYINPILGKVLISGEKQAYADIVPDVGIAYWKEDSNGDVDGDYVLSDISKWTTFLETLDISTMDVRGVLPPDILGKFSGQILSNTQDLPQSSEMSLKDKLLSPFKMLGGMNIAQSVYVPNYFTGSREAASGNAKNRFPVTSVSADGLSITIAAAEFDAGTFGTSKIAFRAGEILKIGYYDGDASSANQTRKVNFVRDFDGDVAANADFEAQVVVAEDVAAGASAGNITIKLNEPLDKDNSFWLQTGRRYPFDFDIGSGGTNGAAVTTDLYVTAVGQNDSQFVQGCLGLQGFAGYAACPPQTFQSGTVGIARTMVMGPDNLYNFAYDRWVEPKGPTAHIRGHALQGAKTFWPHRAMRIIGARAGDFSSTKATPVKTNLFPTTQ